MINMIHKIRGKTTQLVELSYIDFSTLIFFAKKGGLEREKIAKMDFKIIECIKGGKHDRSFKCKR